MDTVTMKPILLAVTMMEETAVDFVSIQHIAQIVLASVHSRAFLFQKQTFRGDRKNRNLGICYSLDSPGLQASEKPKTRLLRHKHSCKRVQSLKLQPTFYIYTKITLLSETFRRDDSIIRHLVSSPSFARPTDCLANDGDDPR